MSESDRRDAPPEVDWSTEGEPVHMNGCRIVCSARGVAIVFTDYQPFPGRGAAPGSDEPKERVVASLRTSPETFFETLASFGSAWNRFVLEQGKPDTLPRFRLFGRPDMQLDGVEDPDAD